MGGEAGMGDEGRGGERGKRDGFESDNTSASGCFMVSLHHSLGIFCGGGG